MMHTEKQRARKMTERIWDGEKEWNLTYTLSKFRFERVENGGGIIINE